MRPLNLQVDFMQQCQIENKIQLPGSTVTYPVLFSALKAGLKRFNFQFVKLSKKQSSLSVLFSNLSLTDENDQEIAAVGPISACRNTSVVSLLI